MKQKLHYLFVILFLSISYTTWAQCGPGEDTEAPVFGNLGDGTMANPFRNLLQSTVGSVPSGVYYFNFNGSTFQGVLDNDTDGGGWLMVLNYVHIAGDTSALQVRNTDLPLLGSSTLGDNEAGTANWGHFGNQLATDIDFEELRFYAETSGHNRIIDFKTSYTSGINYVKTGTGSFEGLNAASNHTTLANHSANLPAQTSRVFTNQGDFALTAFPFWRFGQYHWGLGGGRWEVDDNGGNANNTLHRIWVRGDLSPTSTITLPVRLDFTGNVNITPADFGIPVTDNCGNVNLSLSETNFTCADIGTNVIQLTATDDAGNPTTIDVTVEVLDTNPVITAPEYVEMEIGSTGALSITPAMLNATIQDDCGIDSITLSQTDFTCADVGYIDLTLTAVDNRGNVTSVIVGLDLLDSEPPVVTCKPDFAITLGETGTANITANDILDTATDNCSVVGSNISKTTFTCADIGPNVVTITISDDQGNETMCSTTVTVTVPSCPGNLTLESDFEQCGVIYNFPCSSNITNGPASGTLLEVGTTTTFTYDTLDDSGNVVSCNYDVTVQDTQGPTFLTADKTIDLDASGMATITANDLLGPDPLARDYTLNTTIPFNREDISTTGNPVFLRDDQVSRKLPIGFDFAFYGSVYNEFRISSNGFITFDDNNSSGCCDGQVLPNAVNPNNLIAFDWNDLSPNRGGNIRYETIGTSPNRIMIMDFDNVAYFDDNNIKSTVQVKLYETTNRIEIHSTSISDLGSDKTQGIENADGTAATFVAGRNGVQWSAANDVVAFEPVAGIHDACGVDTLVASQTTFSCADRGENIITITATDTNSNVTVHTVTVTITDTTGNCESIAVAPIVFLQGAAFNPNTGEESLMRDDIRTGGFLPTTTPYSDNATCEATVFNDGGTSGTGMSNDDIVDWIWVELRDEMTNTMIVDAKSALLQRDGDIVDVDGISDLTFNQPAGNYYIAIKHRSHLGIMTLNAMALSEMTTIVDFSDASNQITFGTNAQTSAGMQSGVVAMWTGNANADALVQYSGTTPDTPSVLSAVLNDPSNFLNFPTFVISGYNANDVNMDGSTQYSGVNPDTPFILQNILAHPGNFLNFSTYQIIEQLPNNN